MTQFSAIIIRTYYSYIHILAYDSVLNCSHFYCTDINTHNYSYTSTGIPAQQEESGNWILSTGLLVRVFFFGGLNKSNMNRGDVKWFGVSVTVVSGSPTIRDILQNIRYYLSYNYNTSFPALIAGIIQTIILRLSTSLVKCRLTKNLRMNLRHRSLGLREFHPGRRTHRQSDSEDTHPSGIA